MEEEFSVQMADEVQGVDYRRGIQESLNQQQNAQIEIVNQIGDKIDNIADSITPEVDLTEVTDMLNELDTNTLAAQNEDIIMIVQEQQDVINALDAKLDASNTDAITRQNDNILGIIEEQGNKISTLESKIDLILEKLE